jgi:hypothetical protein
VAVAALWCKGWGGRRPGGRSACLPPFAAAWVRGPLPGAPASAVTLPPRAALTPAPTCAILYERAHCVMETMALYSLYTSSSQEQASAGTSSAPPCARSATLGPPALLLASPRFGAQCARSHTLHSHPSPPAGPWPFRSTLCSPRPSPCSRPVLHLFRAPDSALPAPLPLRRATTPRISCYIRWNRWGLPPPPVGGLQSALSLCYQALAVRRFMRLRRTVSVLPPPAGTLHLCGFVAAIRVPSALPCARFEIGAAAVRRCTYVYSAMACSWSYGAD